MSKESEIFKRQTEAAFLFSTIMMMLSTGLFLMISNNPEWASKVFIEVSETQAIVIGSALFFAILTVFFGSEGLKQAGRNDDD